jgi:hypothetical protein
MIFLKQKCKITTKKGHHLAHLGGLTRAWVPFLKCNRGRWHHFKKSSQNLKATRNPKSFWAQI